MCSSSLQITAISSAKARLQSVLRWMRFIIKSNQRINTFGDKESPWNTPRRSLATLENSFPLDALIIAKLCRFFIIFIIS
eukprot:maker-scaffold_24-snap-gene-4.32-mRNA-1 protein AED:0.01 eAED:0.01 QI:1692/1/0.5/1/1/1/2/0/79